MRAHLGEGPPQMGCALLQQKLTLLNYCVAQKKRRKLAAADAEEGASTEADADGEDGPRACARAEDTGRVGGRRPLPGLVGLHSGAALWEPWTQDPVPMTGDAVEQQQEELIRVGERFGGAGEAQNVLARLQSAQLKSDMQAFKAANPGCCLEDFIRWHSPRDWLAGAALVGRPALHALASS